MEIFSQESKTKTLATQESRWMPLYNDFKEESASEITHTHKKIPSHLYYKFIIAHVFKLVH